MQTWLDNTEKSSQAFEDRNIHKKSHLPQFVMAPLKRIRQDIKKKLNY